MEAFAMPQVGDRLHDAVDVLVDESIDDVSTHALGADLIDIRRAIDRLEAEFIRRLHRFDQAHGALADGGGSTVSWLRAPCGRTGGAAETLEPGAMRVLIQATRLRLDPDGVLADDNHAHERRWFECDQTYGGVFVLRGELDAEAGALVKTAIDALSQGMSRGETRSGSQRRADALVDLAATQLRCGDHRDVHGQRA